MSACPKCGSPVLPTDKFCNSCGFAIAAPAAAGPTNPGSAPAFGAPPPFGAAPQQPPQQPPQQQYGEPPQQYGEPPQQQQQQQHQPGTGSYGGPPPQGPYGPPPGAPPPAPQGHAPFGMDPTGPGGPPPGYGADAYGAPPYGQPQQPQQQYQQQYAPPQQQQGYAPGPGFGGPPPFGAPPNQAPQPSPGFGYGGPPPQAQQQPPQPAGPGAFGQPGPGVGAPVPFGAPPPGAPPLTGAPGPMPVAHDPAAMAQGASNRALRGFMIAYQSNAQGEFWPLYGGRVTLGRANSGEVLDIQLPDPTISSKHAAILVDNVSGAIHVEDTGSTNGTYVNDEHLGFNGRRELRDGDRVRFGGFTTIVKIIGRV